MTDYPNSGANGYDWQAPGGYYEAAPQPGMANPGYNGAYGPAYNPSRVWQPPAKKSHWWVWLLVILGVALLIWLCVAAGKNAAADKTAADLNEPYVGVLYVEGTMSITPSNPMLGSDGGYDHEYLLDSIQEMMKDKNNKGLLLYINSPGGEVIAADELGRAVQTYKDTTQRPVYAYGYSYAASGGYWLACVADEIYLQRYCLTGSIGVTMGTMIDASGLLEKYNIKAYDLASGAQKNAGNGLTPTGQETLNIYQGIINEYYEDFVSWVLEHRPQLSREELLTLADGRVYTARQAAANGLSDHVGEYDEAVNALLQTTGSECQVRTFQPTPPSLNLWELLMMSKQDGELATLLGMLPPPGVLVYYPYYR